MLRVITLMFLFATALTAGTGCRLLSLGDDEVSEVKSTGPTTLVATIPHGVLTSRTKMRSSWKFEVRQQLHFAAAQLSSLGAVADLNQLEVSIDEAKVTYADGLTHVPYAARMLVSWPHGQRWPIAHELKLPKYGDTQGRKEFFLQYGKDCTSEKSAGVSATNFWYHYYPQAKKCPLGKDAINKRIAQVSIMNFNSTGRFERVTSPEYHKVWQDNKLVLTAIFEQAKSGSPTHLDPGVRSMRGLLEKLRARFGEPKKSDPLLESDETWDDLGVGTDVRRVRAIFEVDKTRQIEVTLLIVESLDHLDGDFQRVYNAATPDSDLIVVNSRGSIGSSIRSMADHGKFRPGQYQIFMVNACDTFAYYDNALQIAHAGTNPHSHSSKHFDLVSTAMPSYFHLNANSTLVLVDSLVASKHSYRRILAGFDSTLEAATAGIAENAWPAEFEGE